MRLAMEFTWLGLVETAATVVVDVGWVLGVEDGVVPDAGGLLVCDVGLLDGAAGPEEVGAGVGVALVDCAAAAICASERGLGAVGVPGPVFDPVLGSDCEVACCCRA